jgi:hypothetical protein
MVERKYPLSEVLCALYKMEQDEARDCIEQIVESDIWPLIRHAATNFDPVVHPPLRVLAAFVNDRIGPEEAIFVQNHANACGVCNKLVWLLEDGSPAANLPLSIEERELRLERWKVVTLLFVGAKRRERVNV